MKYKTQLIKVGQEGAEYILQEQEITADEAIEHLLQIQSAVEEVDNALEEEEPEDAPDEPDVKKTKAGRTVRTCKVCGKPGHNKKTCPRASTDKEEPLARQTPTSDPWYFREVLDLLKDEVSEREIYEDMRSRITDAQFREAMAWARSEII